MKNKKITIKSISLLLAVTILFSGCVSTTTIQSNPSGAKVYLNEESFGTTPYVHKDRKVTFSKTRVRLEKEGYEPLNTFFSRDEEVEVGAIVAGFFVIVPWLWTMKYKPTHSYELTPYSDIEHQQKQNIPKSEE
jgi:hypothetical protein